MSPSAPSQDHGDIGTAHAIFVGELCMGNPLISVPSPNLPDFGGIQFGHSHCFSTDGATFLYSVMDIDSPTRSKE